MKLGLWGLSLLLFFSELSFAEPEPLELGTGLWEGIEDDFGVDYFLLQLNQETNQHSLFIANIPSAFRYIKRLPFTNENVSCTSFECTLSINNPYETDINIRVILVPYLVDSLKVLQVSINKEGKPIAPRSYQLDKKKGKSTVRAFVERYRERVLSLSQDDRTDLYGVWIGVADHRDKKQLVIMDVNDNKTSDFVLMLNGTSITNETQFNSDDISAVDDITNINTSHKTFANQIMLHHIGKNILSGHMYSYHKSIPIQTSNFKLFRVQGRSN